MESLEIDDESLSDDMSWLEDLAANPNASGLIRQNAHIESIVKECLAGECDDYQGNEFIIPDGRSATDDAEFLRANYPRSTIRNVNMNLVEPRDPVALASYEMELSSKHRVNVTPLKEQIDELLETIDAKGKRVLQLRFGLEDGRSRTLEEVGREFGLTRERIRQIEAKALRKLRHPTRSKKLRGFLE